MTLFDQLQESVKFIRSQTGFAPRFGIVLGTGLGRLAQEIDANFVLNYSDIPHFPLSTVETHKGKLIFGYLAGKPVVVMQGRFHYYEGYNMQQVTFGIRVMKLLGIEKLFMSNAAGGINPDFGLSDLMVITDHINLLPENPLRGKNDEKLGIRFPDMFETYSRELVTLAQSCASELGISIRKGVYTAVQGPNLETPAEYRFLRVIGTDAVGMSTVPEAITAVHMGLPVFAISVITDLCYEGHLKPVNITEILEAAYKAEPDMTRLLALMVARL